MARGIKKKRVIDSRNRNDGEKKRDEANLREGVGGKVNKEECSEERKGIGQKGVDLRI